MCNVRVKNQAEGVPVIHMHARYVISAAVIESSVQLTIV